eukprot:6473235-Amphidinium_carterae.1
MADTGGARGNGDALPRTLSDQSVAWRSSAAQVHPEHVDIGSVETFASRGHRCLCNSGIRASASHFRE